MERVSFGKSLISAREYIPSEEPTPDDLKTANLIISLLFVFLFVAVGIVALSGVTAINALNE